MCPEVSFSCGLVGFWRRITWCCVAWNYLKAEVNRWRITAWIKGFLLCQECWLSRRWAAAFNKDKRFTHPTYPLVPSANQMQVFFDCLSVIGWGDEDYWAWGWIVIKRFLSKADGNCIYFLSFSNFSVHIFFYFYNLHIFFCSLFYFKNFLLFCFFFLFCILIYEFSSNSDFLSFRIRSRRIGKIEFLFVRILEIHNCPILFTYISIHLFFR